MLPILFVKLVKYFILSSAFNYNFEILLLEGREKLLLFFKSLRKDNLKEVS